VADSTSETSPAEWARPCAARARDAAGDAHDLVTVPARQGLEAVDILRLRTGVGPVLHDRSGDSLAFLVPPGTAEGWDVPGSSCRHTDGEPPAHGAGWLVPPHTDTAVTDPAVLRAALGEAARNVELADGFVPPSGGSAA
jgi:hypothetical protein